MNSVTGLFLILLPLCSAFAGLPKFNKEQHPPIQADVDPNCHNVPGFRQCYSDFLQQFGITDITQPIGNSLNNAFYNNNRANVEFVHRTFDTFNYCLTKQQLHSCVNVNTFQGFGLSPNNANDVVNDFMIYNYIFLTAYQVYYEHFNCFDIQVINKVNITNSPEGKACIHAAEQLAHNLTCSNFENYLSACLPFYNTLCQNEDFGALYCNFVYLSAAWSSGGWTQFSQCNNVCPRAVGKPCSPSPPSGGSNSAAIKSEAFHVVFILASILFLSRLFFK